MMAGCFQPIQRAVGIEPDPAIEHQAALLGPGHDAILVEIDFVAGRAPSDTALDALQDVLADVSGKTVSIDVSEIPAQGDVHDAEGIYAIHQATFDNAGADHSNGEAVTLHVLYLDGTSDGPGDSEFQGIYYTVQEFQGDSLVAEDAVIALLPDYWNGLPDHPLGDLLPDSDFEGRYERAVLIHELGHALGLVGEIPETTARQDGDSPGHSDHVGSVMHSGDVAVAEDALIALRERGYDPVWEFDADDLADLRAYRDSL